MNCTGVYTTGSFLKGISPLVTEEALMWVCAKRKIEPEESYSELTDKESDLAEGTMYYWLSNLPVGGATEKVSDGGFSHSDGGWQVSKANIDAWLQKHKELFEKWGETPLTVKSKVGLMNF